MYNMVSSYPDFAIKHQAYTVGADRLTKETERVYHINGDSTTVVKNISYDPEYLLPVNEEVRGSDGKIVRIQYKYPFQFPLNIYTMMSQANILSPVIEKTTTYGDDPISRETITQDYTNQNGAFYPTHTVLTKPGSTPFYTRSMGPYTAQGKPLQIVQNNSTDNVVYLWSYNHQYPVAAIQGVTYPEVVRILGETFINNLSGRERPTDSEMAAINTLRANTAIPHALVTTATYRSLVGKLSETDPTGLTTYYEYDTLGRLKEIFIRKDNTPNGAKHLLQSFEYNYANH